MTDEKKKKEQVPESVTVIDIAPVEEPETAVTELEVEPTEQVAGLSSLRTFVSEQYGEEFDNDVDLLAFVEARLTESRSSDNVITDILAEYPELYAVIQDLAAGKPIEAALAANLDMDSVTPLEGDDAYASYEEARKERQERKKKIDEHRAMFDKNYEESQKVVEEYFADKTMDEETGKAFAEFMDRNIQDYLDGKVTKEFLDIFYRGMHFEDEVEAAREAGAIDAKNARIDAERERVAAETDGMPSPGSAMSTTSEYPEEDNDMFSEIRRHSRRDWGQR